jgi:hypothetical protein
MTPYPSMYEGGGGGADMQDVLDKIIFIKILYQIFILK